MMGSCHLPWHVGTVRRNVANNNYHSFLFVCGGALACWLVPSRSSIHLRMARIRTRWWQSHLFMYIYLSRHMEKLKQREKKKRDDDNSIRIFFPQRQQVTQTSKFNCSNIIFTYTHALSLPSRCALSCYARRVNLVYRSMKNESVVLLRGEARRRR